VTRRGISSLVVLLLCSALVGVWALRHRDGPGQTCGGFFYPQGGRCCPSGAPAPFGHCADAVQCPTPLVLTQYGCDAPTSRVHIARIHLELSAADWEAEGRVVRRIVDTAAFQLDAFEVTNAQAFCARCALSRPARFNRGDASQAATGLSKREAIAICTFRGGRLPKEDEWIAAAAGQQGNRYPWGATGAVCRRAAWGLTRGPCNTLATGQERGADTVGAHEAGNSALGLYDLAGNAAEWVEAEDPQVGVLRGGSFASEFAAEIRTWSRLVVPLDGHDVRAGVRCAYD
jgi:formylglycine-generating enzyme